MLCLCGITLGKGTLRTYLSLRVPTGHNTVTVVVACCLSIATFHLPVVGGRLGGNKKSTGKNAEFTFTGDYFENYDLQSGAVQLRG